MARADQQHAGHLAVFSNITLVSTLSLFSASKHITFPPPLLPSSSLSLFFLFLYLCVSFIPPFSLSLSPSQPPSCSFELVKSWRETPIETPSKQMIDFFFNQSIKMMFLIYLLGCRIGRPLGASLPAALPHLASRPSTSFLTQS